MHANAPTLSGPPARAARDRGLRRAAFDLPDVTPRRSPRCSPFVRDPASATRSPPTSGRTSTDRPRPRCARRSGCVRTGFAAAGVDPTRCSRSARTRSACGRSSSSTLDVIDVRGARRRTARRVDRRALALYRGDLAEGLGHECFAADRERLSDLYEDALRRRRRGAPRLPATSAARAQAATQVLGARPAPRGGAQRPHRRVRTVGTRSQVVRQYRRLCDILRAELAVRPCRRPTRPTGRRSTSTIDGPVPGPRPWRQRRRAAARCSIARRSPGSSPRAPDRHCHSRNDPSRSENEPRPRCRRGS